MALRMMGLVGLVLLAVSGCAATAPISANPAQDARAALPHVGGFLSVEDGLKEAASNFDSAVSVGIVAAAPWAACLHESMRGLGLEGDPSPFFTPKVTTALGLGSVLIIRDLQAQQLQAGGIALPTSCKEQIGEVVLAVGRANAKSLPGGGFLAPLR